MKKKAVEQYFLAVPLHRKERVHEIHSMILELYPDAQIDLSYKMPTYHVGDSYVALANQKNYISVYTCGYHHIEQFKAKHPKIKTGKGCINFKESVTRLPRHVTNRFINRTR